MEKQSKKVLIEKYKNRVMTGGIYCIKCTANNMIWLRATTDMKSSKNRFLFSVTINSCPEICMGEAWKMYGATAFTFEILEEIKKKEAQTEREFSEDIDVLLDMWTEKQKDEMKGEV